MKRINTLLTIIFTLVTSYPLLAQNPPSMGEMPDDSIIVGSGINYLIIPQLNDGDGGKGQAIDFDVTSSDEGLLQIDSVEYNNNDNLAIIFMSEKGVTGDVTLSVTATDADGSSFQELLVNIGEYQKEGLHFQIHDAVFWQEVIPLTTYPVFDSVIHSSSAPYHNLVWEDIPITVSDGCSSQWCTGHDFFTAMLRGYVIPSADGDYTFFLKHGDDGGIWLSEDEDINNAVPIALKSDNHGNIGTDEDGMRRSDPLNLEAGKRYAIYAVNWIVHTTITDIYWEGPGITKSLIGKENLMYEYDPVWPNAPENLQVTLKGVNQLNVIWNKASDDVKLVGYNIYVDGLRVNDYLIEETDFSIENLTAETRYTIAVASVDRMGNESFLSSLLTAETYPEDLQNPTPPTSIQMDVITGLAAEISWSGAADAETEVIAYNVYLDGVLYNQDLLVFDLTIILKVLSPETSYTIEIEAIDAGFNISAKSDIFSFSTVLFDPFGPKLGVKRGRVTVDLENLSWSEGIGINPQWENGVAITDPNHVALLEELQPGSLRWGGIGANSNSHSFKNHIGTGKTLTYGDWIDHANNLGSYSSISIAVENGSDFLDDVNTFEHFIEYINGPDNTTYGAIRAAEGYGPLLDNSKGLVIEFGNEVWGGDSHMAQIGNDYEKYALWCREAARVMKSSPWYDTDKIHLAISGRNPFWDPLNRAAITGDTGEVDWLTLSGYFDSELKYNPDTDPARSELSYYKDANLQKKSQLGFLRQANWEIIGLTGETKRLYFYESNMSTSTYNGRLGQAITLLDYHLASMKYGGAIPSLFHLTGGQWRITQPADNFRKLPHFHAAALLNRFCKGNVLKTVLASADTLLSSTGYPIIFEPVGGYAFTRDENYSLVLMSRDFENDYYVEIDLPGEMVVQGSARQYVISGSDFSTNVTTIDSSDIDLADGDLICVPKHSMVLVHWTGNDQGFAELPLGYFTYQRPESLTIVPAEGDFLVDVNRGSKYFLTEVEPANTFYPYVKWEIIDNEIGAILNPLPDKIRVKGSAGCDGNGTVTVRAIAINNPLLIADATITISNQGTDCETSVNDRETGLLVYPNPAGASLSVHVENGGSGWIHIYDSMGKLQMERRMEKGSAVLDVESLKPGVHVLTITTPKQTFRHLFVKE